MADNRKDPGHVETDELLIQLERKLEVTYSDAVESAKRKYKKYMSDFARKDKAHKEDVKNGNWTKEQYDNWRKNQLLVSKNYKDMVDVLSQDLNNVDKIAIKMAYNTQENVYAINVNYGTYEIEKGAGVDTSFTLYDHDTVERLMKDDPDLLPRPSAKRQAEIDAKDIKWNKQKLTSAFTASLLNGDDVYKMADAISAVAAMDRKSAIRNARTMATGAECGGRTRAYERAQAMGINIEEEWSATLDEHTRASHRLVDGEIIKVGEKFSNGLRFPGDPEGAPKEIYGCRCTTIAVIDGIDPMYFDKTDTLKRKTGNSDLTYEQWKYGKEKEEEKRKILQAKIDSGEISLTINKDKQARHIGFQLDDRSFFDEDVSIEDFQKFLNENYGTGRIIIYKSGQIKEILSSKRKKGNYKRKTKDNGLTISKKTGNITVHYSKTGSHFVPAKPYEE